MSEVSEFVTGLIQPLNHESIPAVLRSKLEDHRRNLEGLAMSLASSGASEEKVREIVMSTFASFELEFTRTILEIRGRNAG